MLISILKSKAPVLSNSDFREASCNGAFHFVVDASSSSKSTISLSCARNQRSMFESRNISSIVNPARSAWRIKKTRSALGTLSFWEISSRGKISRSP